LGSAADLTYQPIFTTSEITEIEKRITVTSSSREAKRLNSILKHSAGIDGTNFREFLESVVKLKTKAGSGEERDLTAHEKGGWPEREDVTIGRGIRTGIERS
jgi:hypothetical protein